LTDGDDEKCREDVCKGGSKIGVVEDPTESGVDVVTVLEDIQVRARETHTPEEDEESREGLTIVDRRAGVGVHDAGFANIRVDGATRVRTVGTVDADASLAFPHRPLEWGEQEAGEKIYQKAREVNVKRLHLASTCGRLDAIAGWLS
jgi:hypothetical protein